MKTQCYIDPTIEISDSQREILLTKNIELLDFNAEQSNLNTIEYLLLHSQLTDVTLLQMRCCKYIGIRAHNLDYLNTTIAKEMGIEVCGLNKQHGANAVAEHTLALILALTKNLLQSHTNVSNGKWRNGLGLNMELSGKKLGIIGNGAIGKRVGSLGKMLGMQIIVAGNPNHPKDDEIAIQELLKQADIVTLHLSSKSENKNYLNAEKLALMKDQAILINTARGSVLDYEALISELKRGKFYGVGLDVFDEEPYNTDQFANYDNVILTPHVGFQTKECLAGMNEELFDNFVDFLKSLNFLNRSL